MNATGVALMVSAQSIVFESDKDALLRRSHVGSVSGSWFYSNTNAWAWISFDNQAKLAKILLLFSVNI